MGNAPVGMTELLTNAQVPSPVFHLSPCVPYPGAELTPVSSGLEESFLEHCLKCQADSEVRCD